MSPVNFFFSDNVFYDGLIILPGNLTGRVFLIEYGEVSTMGRLRLTRGCRTMKNVYKNLAVLFGTVAWT